MRKGGRVADRGPDLAEQLHGDADECNRPEPDAVHEQRVGVEAVESRAPLGSHAGELRLHRELPNLLVWSTLCPRGVGRLLTPLRLRAPERSIAQVVPQRQRHQLTGDRDHIVRLLVGLVLERGDPGRLLTLPESQTVPAPRRTLGGGRRLVPDHRAEPPVGRELGDEQLRRSDVTACPLKEEAVPPERRLDHPLHDAGVLGRDRGVVRAEDDRMAGVVDDRRNREVVVAVEADDGQRVVDGAVPVETDRGPPVGSRHPPVHSEGRRPATGTDAHRAHRGSSFRRGPCHRVEHRLDVGGDELPVLPDPGPT